MIDVNSSPAQVEKAYWSAQAHVAALSAELADVKQVLIKAGFGEGRDTSTALWVENVIDHLLERVNG